ncbi:MAG TPA: translocation/assembly module TamB domain-containing protein [Acetobacteraceae bacterium]|nr:translocation/assembly module TamB domain-containing protein [Acetobacteraceae bacterium]
MGTSRPIGARGRTAALAALLLALAAAPARASILDDLLPWFSGSLATQGLAIHLNGSLSADTVELKDTAGVYATFHTVRITWSPLSLIHGDIKIDTLTAADGDVARLPKSSSGSGGGLKNLDVNSLEVGRLTLETPLAGETAVLHVTAGLHMHPGTMRGELTAERLDAEGLYHLVGNRDAAGIKLDLAAHEAAGGLIAAAAKLPGIGPVAVDAILNGPESAVASNLALAAGRLHAKAAGTIDLADSTIPGMHIVAEAPAMTPRPGLSWSSVAVTADANGPFTAPDLNADISIVALQVGAAGAGRIALTAAGNAGDIKIDGAIDGLTVPGKQPDLFAAAPVRLVAEAKLRTKGEPVTFAISHPLLQAEGDALLAEELARIKITAPDLAPLAAAAGEQLGGHAVLSLNGGRQNGILTLAATGAVGITGGKAPVSALVGDNATLDLAAQLDGSTLHLARLAVNGQDVALSASGTASRSAVDLQFAAGLNNVASIEPRLSGGLRAAGRITGATDALALDTTITGNLAAEGQSSGPFTAHLVAQGLPSAPSGHLTAEGALLGAPVDLALAGGRSTDGAYHLAIEEAAWKSLRGGGSITLPAGAKLPVGDLSLQIGDLGDFTPLIGKPLRGSARFALNAGSAVWQVAAEADNAALPGTASLSAAKLQVTLDHPADNPEVNGTLTLAELKTGRVAGSAKLNATGPASALALSANADLTQLEGAPARLSTKGVADVEARALRLDTLAAAWKGQDVRLLAPVTFRFAQGLTIEDLRLGLRQAVLRVNGHVGSTLDLTASAANVPADLATIVSPSLNVAGTINADARVTGTSSAPTGAVHARASGLRLLSGKQAALPPATVTANVDLLGNAARLDLAAAAGASHVTLAGTVGLRSGALVDLRANGEIEMATADALLPAGERAAGRVRLAANITGTAAKPDGMVRVDASGLRVLNGPAAGLPPARLIATARLNAGTARIDSRLTAGSSDLAVAGTAGLAKDASLALRAIGRLDLAIANPILLAGGEAARGTLAIDATVGGTLDAPHISGGATLSGGDLRDYAAGVHLSDIAARLTGDGETLRLASFSARAGQGTMTGSGTIGVLAAGMPVNLVLAANNATPISSDVLTATLNANLSITGQVKTAMTIGGTVFIRQAVIQVPDKLPTSVVTIPVRIAGAPPPKPPETSQLLASIGLDLTVQAPQQIFIRGRGLNAELGGTIRIAGTTTEMQPLGQFHLIRGSFNVVGNTLDFTSGSIDFNGASISDPGLHLVATYTGQNLLATLTVGGTARDPKITLSSTPELPQDEILAQILFHTNAGALSPFQLASIAAGIAEITGSGGGLANPLQNVQNALGLDQLGITTGPNGQPVLQAGRYIARGVFVGAEESTGGSGARAKITVDLTRRLKLDASAGTGQTTSAIGATGESTGASVGLRYQFQY